MNERAMTPESIHDQVERAQKELRALAKVAPYMFNEWQELQCAKATMEAAKRRLDRATAAWEQLAGSASAPNPAGEPLVPEREADMYAKGALMAAGLAMRHWGNDTIAGEIIRTLGPGCEAHAEQFDAEALSRAFPQFALRAAEQPEQRAAIKECRGEACPRLDDGEIPPCPRAAGQPERKP